MERKASQPAREPECATFAQQKPVPVRAIEGKREGAANQMKANMQGKWHLFQSHSMGQLVCWRIMEFPLFVLFDICLGSHLVNRTCTFYVCVQAHVPTPLNLHVPSCCSRTLPDMPLQGAGLILGLSIYPDPTGAAETFAGASDGFNFSSALVIKLKCQRSLSLLQRRRSSI